MKARWNLLILLIFSLSFLTGCVSVDGTPYAELALPAQVADAEAPAAMTSTVTTTGTVASTPPSTPPGNREVVEFPLLPLSEGEALRASEIFDLVAPAIAYIETPMGSGSGVLINDGYLVSNAHVVWPYNLVRVVFPDGTEFTDVEVVGWDLMADLSLLKLPETPELTATPQTFVDGSELGMASDIYLIGYPGEVEAFPQPTISQGILARVRTWETTGMDVFQVDADVTGGQSGGVMVTERGEVIGITTFAFTSANYAMVPSAAYAVPRLNALANEPATAFSDRRPLGLNTETEHTSRLADSFDSDVYLLDVEPGEDVEITVEGVGYPQIYVSTVNFEWDAYESEEIDEKVHSVEFTTERDAGPYIITIAQQSVYRNDYTISSSHPLAFYADGDDDIELIVGEDEPTVLSGALDVPGDLDRFFLELKEGEKVAVEIDSLVLTPLLSMIYDTPTRLEFVQSYDGGASNVFGENARIVYEAPEDGQYAFIVDSAVGGEVGGYFLTASVADEDEEPTDILQSSDYRLSPYGRLDNYTSRRNGFEIYFPGDWYQLEECSVAATACFEADAETGFIIVEEDLDRLPVDLEEINLDSYVDLIEELLISNLQRAEVLEREPFITPQGLEGIKLVVSAQAGLVMASRFVYVNEDTGIAFNASYYTTGRGYEEMQEFFDYSFDTFRLWDEDHLEDDPVYHMDEGVRLTNEEEYEAAIESLTRALGLDPELADAYLARANAYDLMGEYDLAIADVEEAIELEPEEIEYIGVLALLYWVKGDLDQALELVTQVISDDPENESGYNNRALMRVQAGDFEGALEDMEEVEEIFDGAIPPNLLDSRAYIYLKMEDYEAAKEDYENILDQDFKSPYSLLGAGIAYARLGLMEEAIPLLEYGMELFDEAITEFPYPQLADLLEMSVEYLPAE